MKPYFLSSLIASLGCFLGHLSAEIKDATSFEAVESEESIIIRHGENDVLTYHKAEVPAPEGADPLYRRSGYIHPVKAPSGGTVTGSRPADHYHHLGLWHAWVRCVWNEHDVDFWNLKAGTGRVRYAKTIKLTNENNRVGFTVEQEHVAYVGDQDAEVLILKEQFDVTARIVEGAYEIDYDFSQTNVSEHTLKFPAYRYGGGIGYRSPFHWDKTNSDYLSSEGATRIDGHETRSNWCAMFGPASESEDIVGLTILCHPENHDAPQRMRVWPPQEANGTIFFNYVPIQETEWQIEPDESVSMRYRVIVQDGQPKSEEIAKRWDHYRG